LNNLQDNVSICSIWINFGEKKHMLNFEFSKQLQAEHNKIKPLFYVIKWFDG
jgi:hypothetical protein